MTTPESLAIPDRQWWHDAHLIDYRVFGVFEGGGAKGVLYAGALEGMLAERCWFDAVAGASAGAITATLVAAGMRPDQIRVQMSDALATLRLPTPLNGAMRVREGASFLNQDDLLSWLRQMLEDSVPLTDGSGNGADVTFDTLYKRTGIELNVVAVDIKRHRRIVFNHRLTPTSQVAEAVVASAAIPFAFEWRWLDVPGRPAGMIVDGGIAANFPSFVFTDRSFRHWAGLGDLPDTTPIVGFLLHEADGSNDESPCLYKDSVFASKLGAENIRRFRPAGVTNTNRGAALGSVRSVVSRVAKIVLVPLKVLLWPLIQFFFNWFPRLLTFNARRTSLAFAGNPSWLPGGAHTQLDDDNGDCRTDGAEPDAFHSRRRAALMSRFGRGLALWLDRILTAIQPWGVLVGALIVITLSLGAGLYHYGWQPLVEVVGDTVNGKLSIGTIFDVIVFLAVIAAALYAWIVLVVLLVTASFTHATTRNIGYGLAKTFLQGPGASPWVGCHPDDHVIRLAVPPDLTTLNASLPDDLIASALAAAHDETRSTMRAIRADAHRSRASGAGDESSGIKGATNR